MEFPKRTVDYRMILGMCAAVVMFGVSQSIILWGPQLGLTPDYLWPSIAIFVLPVVSIFILFGFVLRGMLGDESRASGRHYAWMGFYFRLACAALLPLLLYWEGFTFGIQHQGILFPDAQLRENATWGLSQSPNDLLDISVLEIGQVDGGLTILGVFIYRFFYYAIESPMVLVVWMAFLSACAIPVAYRAGEMTASSAVAKGAALIVAFFPDGVLIGSTFAPQGMLISVLGLWLCCCVAFFMREAGEVQNRKYPRWIYAIVGIFLIPFVYLFFADYFNLFLILYLLSLIWFLDIKTSVGRWTCAGVGATVLLLAALSLLAYLHIAPAAWDLAGNAKQYFFDYAWAKTGAASFSLGNDLFENIIRILPRPAGFCMIAVYGLLQPFLPAVLGSKAALASEGLAGAALSIVRSIGWFFVMPFILYGIAAAVGTVRSNKFPSLCGVLFLVVACTGAFRFLGDQWNNPFFRMIALVPMAVLVAWTAMELRRRRRWFIRIVFPFLIGVGGLTGWYLLRSYFGITLPSLLTFLSLTAVCVLVFFLLIFFHIPKADLSPLGEKEQS